ncbi:MAG TPA: DUF4404 family protein [Steroidobacteraceae bacterium]|jgi:hypothetical protein|nr:DUF4404 family protein [Steroidobacteraceae bacterium]
MSENTTEESLRGLLSRVHERLHKEGGSLDAESRKLLSTLVRDIDRALGKGGTRGVADTAGAHTPRLESLAVRFEADHPGLAEVVREIIDALGRVGI